MTKWLSATGLCAALMVQSVFAAESPEDAYAACVIGKAAVLMHQKSDLDTAAAVAWQECEPLANGIAEDEGEGIADFVYMTLQDIAD